jgi:hypothetical protein
VLQQWDSETVKVYFGRMLSFKTAIRASVQPECAEGVLSRVLLTTCKAVSLDGILSFTTWGVYNTAYTPYTLHLPCICMTLGCCTGIRAIHTPQSRMENPVVRACMCLLWADSLSEDPSMPLFRQVCIAQ